MGRPIESYWRETCCRFSWPAKGNRGSYTSRVWLTDQGWTCGDLQYAHTRIEAIRDHMIYHTGQIRPFVWLDNPDG